jgi:DNA gyrase subunit A
VGAVQVFDGDEVMLVSDQGTLVRTRVNEVSVLGRNTQGVTLIKVDAKEKLVGVERIEDRDEDEDSHAVANAETNSVITEENNGVEIDENDAE